MANIIKKITVGSKEHDIDAKYWNGMSTDNINFTSPVGINSKSEISSEIDSGEFKVFHKGKTKGFIIKTIDNKRVFCDITFINNS